MLTPGHPAWTVNVLRSTMVVAALRGGAQPLLVMDWTLKAKA